jgi:hypothetical protein
VSLPVIFWLWTDLHGGFILGYCYLALHMVGRGRDLLPATLLAVAVSLINPYGYRLVLFPFGLMARGSILESVVEWRSLDFRTAVGGL